MKIQVVVRRTDAGATTKLMTDGGESSKSYGSWDDAIKDAEDLKLINTVEATGAKILPPGMPLHANTEMDAGVWWGLGLFRGRRRLLSEGSCFGLDCAGKREPGAEAPRFHRKQRQSAGLVVRKVLAVWVGERYRGSSTALRFAQNDGFVVDRKKDGKGTSTGKESTFPPMTMKLVMDGAPDHLGLVEENGQRQRQKQILRLPTPTNKSVRRGPGFGEE